MATLGQEKRAAALLAKGEPHFWKGGGWSFGLSFDAEDGNCWIFSAMPFPKGHKPTERDWQFLRQTLVAIGGPVESLATPLHTREDGASLYWAWTEDEGGKKTPAPLPDLGRRGIGGWVPTTFSPKETN